MNCQNFESVVNDLARGRMLELAAREGGLAHADSCARCATRLAGERKLTSGLRALAQASAHESAPAHVEAALVSAFRERASKTNNSAAHGDAEREVVAPAHDGISTGTRAFGRIEAARTRRRFSGWELRAAAVVAMFAAGLVVTFFLHDESIPNEGLFVDGGTNVSTPAREGDGETSSTAQGLEPQSSPQKLSPQAVAVLEGAGGAPDDRFERAGQQSASRRLQAGQTRMTAARYGEASAASGVRPHRGARAAGESTAAEETEIATDFFPLAGASELMPTQGGHVVRVELPRTALASFGLAVNGERTSGRVKADVLLGDDGMARAIRFVR